MRRRDDPRESMTKLAALSVLWFVERGDQRRRALALRYLGRLPDKRDVADARAVLGRDDP